MLTPTQSRPASRRPARSLVCPDCGAGIELVAGVLHCRSIVCFFTAAYPPDPTAPGPLRLLAVGSRLTPDCHLSALACWSRRTARECRGWFARRALS